MYFLKLTGIGEGIPDPVMFVHEGGALYTVSLSQSELILQDTHIILASFLLSFFFLEM